MENANNNTLPAINTEGFLTTINTAPEVLEKNTLSRVNAEKAVKNLVETIQKTGMTPELDTRASQIIDKLKTTVKTMNERRQPITQLLDGLKKEFTKQESDMKPLIDTLQDHRDKYASILMEERKKKEKEAQEKLAKQREEIECTKMIQRSIARNYAEKIQIHFNALSWILECMTLQTEKETRNKIFNYPGRLNPDELGKVILPVSTYLDNKEMEAIRESTLSAMYPEFQIEFSRVMSEKKREIIDRVESKLDELKRIEKANDEEMARIKLEIEARQKAAEERAKEEAEEAKRKASQEAEERAAVAGLMATINSQAEISTEAPKVKEGYKIEIKNPAGYVLTFQFWWDREGSKWPADKIERMTIARMVAFCETWAAKTEEKIKSDLVVYSEIYKAK